MCEFGVGRVEDERDNGNRKDGGRKGWGALGLVGKAV